MNMGKKIPELREAESISGESSYPVSMGDGTGVKQVKHKTLVEQLLTDMEMPYDETLEMLTEAGEDKGGEGGQKIPNLQAVSDWIRSKIVNNLLATEEGFFLDARIGQALDKRITANATAISQLNSDLNSKISGNFFVLRGTFSSIELKQTYEYGKTYSAGNQPVFCGGRVANVDLVTSGHIKEIRINNESMTITRDAVTSYADVQFALLFYAP